MAIAGNKATTARIDADAVTGAKVADDAIDSEHYTDGSIDNAHIADDAIDSEHYANGSIDTDHIGDDQVTYAKMQHTSTANRVLGAASAGAIGEVQVATAMIAADAVDGDKLADDACDSEHYTDGSIDTAHIADNQVTVGKLADLARGSIIIGNASAASAELTKGGANTYLKSDGTDIAWASVSASGAFEAEDLLMTCDLSNNTAGGSATSGAWRTLVINTTKKNNITSASLSSNQITLPAGTYCIRAWQWFYHCARNKLRFYDTTNTAAKVIGGSNYLDTDYNSAPNWLVGYFVLSGSAACELQYQVQTTMATQGLGIETNFSTTEQYTSVAIWKVA